MVTPKRLCLAPYRNFEAQLAPGVVGGELGGALGGALGHAQQLAHCDPTRDPDHVAVSNLRFSLFRRTSVPTCRHLRGAGDAVEVSPVMGNGFKVGQLPVADFDTLLLFATGSGIAPVKALIESQDLQACTAPSLVATAFRYPCFARPRSPRQPLCKYWLQYSCGTEAKLLWLILLFLRLKIHQSTPIDGFSPRSHNASSSASLFVCR